MFKWIKAECSHAEAYEKLLQRWIDVEARVSRLEMNEDNMRNMARKIQKPRENVEQEPKSLKESILIAE